MIRYITKCDKDLVDVNPYSITSNSVRVCDMNRWRRYFFERYGVELSSIEIEGDLL